jgi:hypothetical protein
MVNTRRNKKNGGTMMNKNKNKAVEGGKRRRGTRRLGRKASEWTKHVQRIYKELKSKNSAAKLGDAMKEASRRKKNGTL